MSSPKTSAKSTAKNYSPLGCNQPVIAHLTAAEHAAFKQFAEDELRSMSAAARMLIIEGLERRTNQPE